MASLMMQLALSMTEGMDKPAAAFVRDRVEKSWAMAEARLGESEFFGGRNLTTADIMIVYILTTSRAFREAPLDDYPNIRAYLQRIGVRPAYQRAMAKAEPGWTPKLDSVPAAPQWHALATEDAELTCAILTASFERSKRRRECPRCWRKPLATIRPKSMSFEAVCVTPNNSRAFRSRPA